MDGNSGTNVPTIRLHYCGILCYCKPVQVKSLNIQNSGFDFKNIDFEIDRYSIDSNLKITAMSSISKSRNYRYNV